MTAENFRFADNIFTVKSVKTSRVCQQCLSVLAFTGATK